MARKSKNLTCGFVVALGLSAALLTQAGCTVTINGGGNAGAGAGATAASDQAKDSQQDQAIELTSSVSKDEKYGSVKLSADQSSFDACGYTLGDSVNVEFSNGFTLTDVPYFNGYYVKTGEPVVVAYPGFDYVAITYNNQGMWDQAGLADGDTVTITLCEKGKYLATQEALSQSYPSEREKYDSDEQFVNFRALTGGRLKANYLYRGASPVDNSHGRAAYSDDLLEANRITCVIDLADSADEMQGYFAATGFDSPYVKGLYEQGRVVTLSMSSSYSSDAYKQSVATGMRHLLQYGGPAYIHCMEGKDRTGFVCALVEALAGASYDEMCADYMQTYANYYGITKASNADSYDAIVSLYFDAFIEYLTGAEDGQADKGADYSDAARDYLISAGMSDAEIDQLVALICE